MTNRQQCPNCNYEVVAGLDMCSECGLDLSEIGRQFRELNVEKSSFFTLRRKAFKATVILMVFGLTVFGFLIFWRFTFYYKFYPPIILAIYVVSAVGAAGLAVVLGRQIAGAMIFVSPNNWRVVRAAISYIPRIAFFCRVLFSVALLPWLVYFLFVVFVDYFHSAVGYISTHALSLLGTIPLLFSYNLFGIFIVVAIPEENLSPRKLNKN